MSLLTSAIHFRNRVQDTYQQSESAAERQYLKALEEETNKLIYSLQIRQAFIPVKNNQMIYQIQIPR